MRGLWVTDYTDFDKLSIEDIPQPPLAPKQIRLKVGAAGISFSVNLVVAGKYQRKPPLPFTPGTECAGTVIECGADVTRFKLGDRVCAALDWGAYAEEAIAWEVNTYAIPDNLEFAEATNFNSYATSSAALTWPRLLNVQPGETLLVHGAAGAIGLAAIEIGKILGAIVIATASTAEKRAAAQAHGADHVIDYSGGAFRDEVNEITGGRGADAILDPVGGDVFDQSLRCIAFEGRIAPVGFTAGRAPQIPANIVLVKNITVCGLNFGTYYGWSPNDVRYEMEDRVRAILDRFYQWAKNDMIHPHVCATFPLEDFRDAMAMVTARQSIGRVALVMDR
ncbi:MAG: NADPH:quinone oxidoreductase family protein [Proteobacteria bacterium]|nr:NADPH:quinone oxidoreductase family protein [Pseudomonadota bacterium]